MRIVHIADPHLGYRAYNRVNRAGLNAREADVFDAFRQALAKTVQLQPDLILIAGDLFHVVRPSNLTIQHTFKEFISLRAKTDAPIVIIGGNHDSPRSADAGCILDLFANLPGIHVAHGEYVQVPLKDLKTSVFCLSHRALRDFDSLQIAPDAGSRYNILMVHATLEGIIRNAYDIRAIPRERVIGDEWDCTVLGHYHIFEELAPNAYYAGSLEYTSPCIWSETRKRKGFIEYDLDERKLVAFHEVDTREVVDLRPIDAADLAAAEVDRIIEARVEGIGGGHADKIVRLVVENLHRSVQADLDFTLVRRIRAEALHFELQLRPPARDQRSTSPGDPGTPRPLEEEWDSFAGARQIPGGLTARDWQAWGETTWNAKPVTRNPKTRNPKPVTMKLISLDLRNFRQHLDTRIDFADGVTGIIGPNGAGKTTILEAIAWALYGHPAIRGNNESVRSTASEGGARVSAELAFELSGCVYNVRRTIESGGRGGSAVLEVDGKPLRTGVTEVGVAIAKLLGMDYQQFFTSFFTGQKQLEFMSHLDGRARAAAISRMLGYERLTKARDQANEDRKGLAREIEGLEKGLADPEDLKRRKAEAQGQLASAKAALDEAEKAHASAGEDVTRLEPAKLASDQKAKRHDELTRRLEIDRAGAERAASRLAELQAELAGLEASRKELDSLADDLARYEKAGEEYKKLKALQEHEGERQRLSGQVSTLEQDAAKLESRARQLAPAEERATRAAAALTEAETLLADAEVKLQSAREGRIAREQGIAAQIGQWESHRAEVEAKRAQIAEAGADGKCPTCERPLAGELPKVLANFDSQMGEIARRIEALAADKAASESDTTLIDSRTATRAKIAGQVADMRQENAKADAQLAELATIRGDVTSREGQLAELRARLAAIPAGFDQARFTELHKTGLDLKPAHDRAIALRSALEREPAVRKEAVDLGAQAASNKDEIAAAERALSVLAFSSEEHEKLASEFEQAFAQLAGARIELERQRGEVNTAAAILAQIESEEQAYASRLDELSAKRSERLHLQVLAEAFDRLRAELNDRIRPELEAIASELLATMTDGRYNVLEINDDYRATIRDDGELKPVISGGEDDIVNLALRLAVSQMIADRAGQSFSLLVLDEVFGSLDDARRDNVVSLLQNLKNRFEQIVLITHVEAIHDAVDNCLWVAFDEKTKTSRLADRSREIDQPGPGALV